LFCFVGKILKSFYSTFERKKEPDFEGISF